MSSALKSFVIGFLAISTILWSPFSIGVAVSEPNLNDGLWEITAEVEMQGMPMKMPAVTHTQCITQENAVPDGSQMDRDCEMITSNTAGDIVTWEMECDGPEGKTKMVGEITYTSDTFEGTLKMEMQGMPILQKMRGLRIGECNQ